MVSSDFSAQRPADIEIYSGYEDVLGSKKYARSDSIMREIMTDSSSSYWIVGERKMGKTSMLLYLEDMLANHTHVVQDPWLFLPLYVSCQKVVNKGKRITQLSSFYQQILERVEERWGNEPYNLSIEPCVLLSQKSKSLSGDQLLEQFVQDMSALFTQLPSNKIRVVLLIDDVEKVSNTGWRTILFAHLKRLLSDELVYRNVSDFSSQNIAVFLASDPLTFNKTSRLRSILKKPIELKALDLVAVHRIVKKSGSSNLDTKWVEKIFRASSGHPWLVQYIMEQFCSSFIGQDKEKFTRNFDGILRKDFQKSKTHRLILQYWFNTLPSNGVQLIVFLLLRSRMQTGVGLSSTEIAEALNLLEKDVKNLLNPMRTMGILYMVPSELGIKAYDISDIFKFWFLQLTGGDVWQQHVRLSPEIGVIEIEQRLAKPFYLYMSLRLDLLVADGLYTRFGSLPAGFNEIVDSLARGAEEAGEKGWVKINDTAKFLKLLFIDPTDWSDVWERYFELVQEKATFICKIEHKSDEREELLDFPIEFLKIRNEFIALEVPMFKQVIGLEKERSYASQKNCFQQGKPVNFLLVSSNVSLDPLPYADEEMNDICSLLLSEPVEKIFMIGQILVLINDKTSLTPEVQAKVKVLDATVDNFERALKGELNEQKFDIIHYSGHYIVGDSEKETGFVFQDEQVFSLPQFNSALRSGKPDFVYLSSCRSGSHEGTQTGHYLGAALGSLKAGVLAVIGMRWPIYDKEAQYLSKDFYESLIQNGSPEKALLDARIAAKNRGGVTWAAPVMLTR